MLHKSFLKGLYAVLGSFFLLLGVVGVFIPLLPTTPNILLTLFFFAKVNKKWHNRILYFYLWKDAILEWKRSKSISFKNKIKACVLLMTSIVYIVLHPLIFLPVKIVVPLFLTFLMIFILTRKKR